MAWTGQASSPACPSAFLTAATVSESLSFYFGSRSVSQVSSVSESSVAERPFRLSRLPSDRALERCQLVVFVRRGEREQGAWVIARGTGFPNPQFSLFLITEDDAAAVRAAGGSARR
jgi:hypothetical protein